MYGEASAPSGTNYGVYGRTSSSTGYAGYFEGGRNYFEGKVGIGTNSPIAKLEVDGRIHGYTDDPYYAAYFHNEGDGEAVVARANTSIVQAAAVAALNTGIGPGIYARSDNGLAAHLDGDVSIDGSLVGNTHITGSARISGPLYVTGVLYGDYGNAQYDTVSNRFWYDNTSHRVKENITPLADDFDKLLAAVPRAYTRPGDSDRWEIGYIAEEFAELGLERLMYFDEEGAPFGVNYSKLPLFLTQIVKGHRQRLEAKDAEIAELGARLEKLEAVVAVLAGEERRHPVTNRIETRLGDKQ